jgi:ABC-2 type transport system permease protein
MRGLLHGELIKLRTTRTALGFALVLAGLMLLSVLVQALVGGGPDTLDDKRSTVALGATLPTVLIVFGAVGATGEHRHGTITSALLIAPDRVQVTAAKLIAYAVAGGLVGLVVQLVAFAIGVPLIASGPGGDLSISDLAGILLATVVACGLSSAIGVGVGALIRNQVAAVVGSLAYLFIVESILAGVADSVYRWLIGGATSALAGIDAGGDPLSPVAGGFVLAGWALALGAASVLADRARDVA